MANRINKIENQYPEGIQKCANIVDGDCYPADKVCYGESCSATITAQVTMTTKFPKLSYPGIVKRKLGSNHWDKIHEVIQGRKRDASECPSDYQLCPKSMNGGCCPNNRSCGTSSCYLTSAASASACGVSGYTACGIDDGGGCCPNGYSCATDGCSASLGVSYSEACGASSYLCPASLNYGCCKNGMGCGLNDCYSTAISTFTLTETFTTTGSDLHPQTITSTLITASTPASPSVAANTSKASAVPKLTPTATAIPKTEASSGSTSTSSGLTKPEIGGIIGVAAFILVFILIAAFCILSRLKKATKAYQEAKTRSGSSVPRSQRHRPSYPSPSDMSSISFDPLQMSTSEMTRSVRNNSHPVTEPFSSERHDGPEVVTPPTFNPYSPFSPHSYPNRAQTHARGYYPVATSDSAYSQTSSGHRNPSVEYTPPLQQPQSYFDIPPHPQSELPDFRNQNLRHGHDVSPIRRPSHHGRNWSDASDVSASSSSPLVELDAGIDGELKFSLGKAWKVLGLGSWKGRVSSKRKLEAEQLSGSSTKDSPTNTLDRDLKTVLSNVPEEAGSFVNEPDDHVDEEIRVQSRPRSGGQESRASRPRSGLSNAELREASIKNVVKAKSSKTKEIMIRNSGGAEGARASGGKGKGKGNGKAEEAGF
ncbi:hypothetical protein SBOR_8758 [Sclerotinia borealis F-4128]|uniref:Uncharacterized protein n=1 Tax=Sclerotinia borealis (strain F-4128) TaxID=1432307 RepID=W9C4T2_SCLBF|nr:hypothetical protein SBOR_8758 [Sclerotinia borealis F-4128]